MTENSLRNRLPGPGHSDHLVHTGGETYAATHLIVDIQGAAHLDCARTVERALRDCVAACKATLLHIHLHRFAPQGVSGVAMLAESHISVHTWPEANYAAFDIFMCGQTQPWNAVDVLRRAFAAQDVRVTELRRGAGIV